MPILKRYPDVGRSLFLFGALVSSHGSRPARYLQALHS